MPLRQGADLLVCPEMYLTGYAIGPAAVRRLAEPVDGPSAARAAAIAREAGMALLYGYPELGADGRVYNAALLLDRDGRPLANHRKTHLYGDLDRNAFSAGDGPPTIAELDGVRLGILICYDVEFPENVRLLALAGAELMAVPTANMVPFSFVIDHAGPDPRLREPPVRGLRQPLRPRGRPRLCRPVLRRRPRRARPRPRRRRRGADRRRRSTSPGCATRPPLNPYLADRRPELYAGLDRTGTRP